MRGVKSYWAVDVGGTKVEIGVGQESGQWLATRRIPTPELGKGSDIAPRLAAALLGLAKEAGGEKPVAVGIGSPGPLDTEQGLILQSSNLPDWNRVPVVPALQKALGVPAFLENDATAAALGEWRFGAGQGVDDLVYLTISTGIGAGIVAGGVLLEGTAHNAGEMGHVVAKPDGVPCHCGLRGCFETVASGTAIGRIGEERRAESPLLRAHPGPVDAPAVFQAAREGDAVAQAIVDEAATWLGWGVGTVINLFNPKRVVLGGGVIAGNPGLVDLVRERVPAFSMPDLRAQATVVAAALGGNAGVAGALAVALTRSAAR
jgi:glucokinase